MTKKVILNKPPPAGKQGEGLMSKPLCVLMVEDSEDDALLTIRELKKGGYAPEYKWVETAETMRNALREQAWDIILCDYKMPQFNGLDAIALLRETGIDIPIIIVSGAIGEETAVECMLSGAHDYVTKGNLFRLVPAIVRELKDAESRRDRKQAEKALRESEERYRTIIENIEDGYFEVDIAGNFIFFNDSVCRMAGYTRAELMGMNNRQYTDKENRQILYQAFNKVFRTGEPSKGVAYEIIGKDKTRLYIESSVSLIRNTSGQPIGFRGIMRNITERKQAEEAITLAKEDWESTFSTITDMVTVHDMDFNIIRANPAAKSMFGLQLEEGIPLVKCFRCYHGTETPPSGCASCQSIQTGKTSVIEMFEPYLNRHLEIRAMPRFGSDHQMVGLIHVVRDITERKRAEEKLQETFESLRKSFAATIQVMVAAVEFRDPYTSGHQIRSADLARAIASEMGLSQDIIEGLRMAGSIHDIGKLSIPAEILSKPTKLSEIEFLIIKEHARKGYEMLKDVESPWPLAQIVYQHHERMDGSGYPRNLKGEEICMEARILAVADVVEAMASHRPYRPSLGIDAALAEIEKNRGIVYDDAVADACLRLFREKGFQLEGT